MEIVTRKDAVSKGLSKYFTGVACRNGHVAPRYTQSATCEECIRESKALTVISTPGQILAPERAEIVKSKINIEQQKITLRAQRLSIEQQRLQLQLDRRAERTITNQRKSIAKTQLVDVTVLIDPLDFEMVARLVWSFAVLRSPLLRRDETTTGRELSDSRHVMRCFPEDKAEILRLTSEMFYSRRPGSQIDEQKLLENQKALDSKALEDSQWPSDDPR
jgi:hypothetical protein